MESSSRIKSYALAGITQSYHGTVVVGDEHLQSDDEGASACNRNMESAENVVVGERPVDGTEGAENAILGERHFACVSEFSEIHVQIHIRQIFENGVKERTVDVM